MNVNLFSRIYCESEREREREFIFEDYCASEREREREIIFEIYFAIRIVKKISLFS